MKGSDKNAPKAPRPTRPLRDDERAALLKEWEKTRAGLSSSDRQLDGFLPLWSKITAGIAVVIVAIGGIALFSMWSAPREVREVEGTIVDAGKLDSDGTARIVVVVPGQKPKMMTYHGPKEPRAGQKVVLEEFDNPVFGWKNYRLKDTSK